MRSHDGSVSRYHSQPSSFVWLVPLKVGGNEKRGGVRKETVVQILYGIVAIGGYFKFERAVSL